MTFSQSKYRRACDAPLSSRVSDLFFARPRLRQAIERDVLPRFSVRRQDNALMLMQHLYARPIVSVKAVAALIGTTQNTASALISDFVALSVLRELTGQRRNRLFLFEDYIALFRR